MSRMSRNWMLAVLAIAGLFVMVGCQADHGDLSGRERGRSAKRRQSPYPSTRLPIRRREKRSFRKMSQQCEGPLREVETWDSDAHLTRVGEADVSMARTSIFSLRASLEDLRLAAERGNISQRTSYARATENYQQAVSLTGPINRPQNQYPP